MTAAKITGTPKVVILKARPRTCSRYSRLATSQILRIDFASDRLDKDLFERRLDHFKTKDGSRGRRFTKKLLGVAVILQADLCVTGEVLGFSDLRTFQEFSATLKLDNDAIA